MVKIIDFKSRENETGNSFNVFIVMGKPEVIRSKETGKSYVTARRASIPNTFDDLTNRSLIGTNLPGQIIKVQTDQPYTYTIPETGEKIELSHQFQYIPDETMEDTVFEGQVEQPVMLD